MNYRPVDMRTTIGTRLYFCLRTKCIFQICVNFQTRMWNWCSLKCCVHSTKKIWTVAFHNPHPI